MLKRLAREYHLFFTYPHDMRVLLITNLIFGFAMPVVYMFISAYVIRNSDSLAVLLTYQLASYAGIPFTFLVNGYLLRLVSIRTLYGLGMILSGVSMAIMMALPALDLAGVAIAGLVMGMSFGLYWANRDYLALNSTNDQNRNYYYGLETFFGTTIGLIVPMAVGFFIVGVSEWLGDANRAYQILTVAVFVVALLASVVIQQGRFENPPPTQFLYWKFHRLWMEFQIMAVLKGLAQGYIVTAPAMLVTRFIGQEGALGTAQSVGAFISAILLYVLGRVAQPRHRVLIFTLGLTLFALGGVANAILFDRLGAILFVLLLLPASPLLDFAYFPIQMQVIDTVSAIERRNQFAYIFNHEFGLFIGRFLGCGLFIVLATRISDNVALRYALLVIGLLQLLSALVARHVVRGCNRLHALAPSPEPAPKDLP